MTLNANACTENDAVDHRMQEDESELEFFCGVYGEKTQRMQQELFSFKKHMQSKKYILLRFQMKRL